MDLKAIFEKAQIPSDLVTRDELARLAQAEGLELTERTIRYWAKVGLIPHPRRVPGTGLKSFYPRSLLERLRVLAATRPGAVKRLREGKRGEVETVRFGTHEFRLLPELADWEEDGKVFSLRVLEDGSGFLLIQRRQADEIAERSTESEP